MKRIIIFVLFPIIIAMNSSNKPLLGKIPKAEEIAVQNTNSNEIHVMAKVKTPNINEILWLWHKYKIRRIYSHCLMTDAERKAQRDQQSTIFLKYGNLFWGTVQSEVDSIEKNNLGYKKTELLDLEKYLNRYGFTSAYPSFTVKKPMFAFTSIEIDSNGKLLNIELDVEGSKRNFGKEKSEKFKARLSKILEKTPFIKPSTFLNEGIDDHAQIFITPLK
jgi:hypothetical protein